VELAVRAEGPRILLDPILRETLANGASGTVEPRAAAAWLAHKLISDAGGSIQLSDPSDAALTIGAQLPSGG
jgi:histidine phosphotransferase ChpT